MAFLLDSNILIDARNRYYAPDICPGFWDWLELQATGGSILSVVAVRDELIGRDDDLTEWVRARADSFFLAPDANALPHLQSLSSWVTAQRYRPAAVTEFLSSADYYLIAAAMAHGHTVVTHETPSNAVNRVKIPEPCLANNVPVVSPFVMLRRLGARFALATP